MRRMDKLIRYLWASPCSLIGLVLGAIPLLLGGRLGSAHGTLEITYRSCPADCGKFARSMRFRGICFGHVILAVTREELARIGPHERVHVRQYELWGILFFPAYAASSLWQLVRGRSPYHDNCFEIQARERSRNETLVN